MARLEQVPELTARQREVLNLVAKGFRNREIGELLRLSERTVKWHVAGLLTTFEASNRTELVAVWMGDEERRASGHADL